MLVVMEEMSKIGKKVTFDEKRWKHVQEHPEMKGQIEKLRETIVDPDGIHTSLHDASVWLFYRQYRSTPVTEKHLLAVVRNVNEEGFIVTAFFTDTVKRGGLVWRKP